MFSHDEAHRMCSTILLLMVYSIWTEEREKKEVAIHLSKQQNITSIVFVALYPTTVYNSKSITEMCVICFSGQYRHKQSLRHAQNAHTNGKFNVLNCLALVAQLSKYWTCSHLAEYMHCYCYCYFAMLPPAFHSICSQAHQQNSFIYVRRQLHCLQRKHPHFENP